MRSPQPGSNNEAGLLADRLESRHGSPYSAYREVQGRYAVGPAVLEILQVQPDPYAPASRLRISVPLDLGCPDGLAAAISDDPERFSMSRDRLLGTEDFVARRVEDWLTGHPEVGSVVRIDPGGQQILRRTAVAIRGDRLELLLDADLPANRRRIEGHRAAAALAGGVPRLVNEVLSPAALDRSALKRHQAAVADHRGLESALEREGWIGFVADGSHLARRAGDDDAPLHTESVPFEAPPELAAEVTLPHAGRVRGAALPAGILLLCGGAFHGKSTLLRALAAAVYPHIPGDGRELVASEPTAMGIRAESGRAVTGIDLSPFLHDMPDGSDPSRFRTQNASGATSQAAAVIEALSSGCRCLLIDEDTSATNFLLRDPWMARLLRPDREPITPLLSRLREIHGRFGASVILVVGGSGEAFRVADRAILMDSFRPVDETARVVEIARAMGPAPVVSPAIWPAEGRMLRPKDDRRDPPRIRALSAQRLLVGKAEIDLSASGALVHAAQGRTLASILSDWFARGIGSFELPGIALEAAQRLEASGPGAFVRVPRGDLAEVRAQEIMMLVDRLRTLSFEERHP